MEKTILKDTKEAGTGKVIEQDGQLKMCPFQQPLLIPGHLQGQVSIMYKPCGSWCQHFEIIKHGSLGTALPAETNVKITCGSETIIRTVEEAPEKRPLSIIKNP